MMIIPTENIGAVIGPGGKIIQEIQSSTQTIITIEEINGHGEVTISGPNQDSIEAALARIRSIVAVPEVGEIYRGKIKSIVAFGAFVEIFPGKEGLLHISEISHERINKVEDVLKDGQMVEVKLIGVDTKTGKMKLSMRALLPKPDKKAE
jgi:polyribonucleotide nucleotidyltransferase